jgi:uncharacterized membrane protein
MGNSFLRRICGIFPIARRQMLLAETGRSLIKGEIVGIVTLHVVRIVVCWRSLVWNQIRCRGKVEVPETIVPRVERVIVTFSLGVLSGTREPQMTA